VQVVEIGAGDTHDLRRRVLRNGTASDVVVFDGDDLPTTFHLGISSHDGRIVAISTWLQRPHPGSPGRPAHQLRGMATAPDVQRAGLGSELLAAGITACGDRGSEIVWAHARSTALAFYERHGFTVCGDEYVEGATGLAHVDVVRSIGLRAIRPD
jgi:predicted GNAT family N-acyltransferase